MLVSLLVAFAKSVLRHGLTVAGGWLMAKGLADESSSQELVGAGMAIGGQALSLGAAWAAQKAAKAGLLPAALS